MIASGRPLRLAIIGGGFTGAAFAIHAIKAAARRLTIDIVEPAARIGRGAAYSAVDPAHRINVPSDRMSLFRDDPTHFTRWLFDQGYLPDRGSIDALGRHYPPRSAFGAYVEYLLNYTIAQSRYGSSLRHRHSRAIALQPTYSGWRVELSDRSALAADIVALCTGHSVGAPCPISAAACELPGLIGNPWTPGALDPIERGDRVLIVGTGLTMADVVATLGARGHEGPITAVSRHGLLPREHGYFVDDIDFLGEAALPGTALELLRLVRRQIRECGGEADWQAVVDALRRRLPEIWPALPVEERRRALRRLLPFWEVHRFRISPQAHTAVAGRLARQSLTIERAKLISLDARQGGLAANLRLPAGPSTWRAFDAVVLCAGPSKNLRNDPFYSGLLARGLARIDEIGLGLDVDSHSRVRDQRGLPQAGLLAFGPITRGSFGEMTGAPDIVRHIERIIGAVVSTGASAIDPIQRGRQAASIRL
jgi:uncharacterized NAD(P)/FAD-binding protein YdhS